MLEQWRRDAACLGVGAEVFFPERTEGEDNHGSKAKAICASCTVQPQCLSYAIRANESHGIWGGVGFDRRARIRSFYTRGDVLGLERAIGEETEALARSQGLIEDDRPEAPERLCERCGAIVAPGRHPPDRNGPQATCGLPSTYNKGCRCRLCIDGKSFYGASHRGRVPARGMVANESTSTVSGGTDMTIAVAEAPTVAQEAKAAWNEAEKERRIRELEQLLAQAQRDAAKGSAADSPFDPEIFQPTHLALKGELDEATWARLWFMLEGMEGSLPFWIGDALVMGEKLFDDTMWQYIGEKFEWKTVIEHQRICARLPRKYRVKGVAWSHHKYVADVTDDVGAPDRNEQLRILRAVRDEGWTTEVTRRECQVVKARLRGEELPATVTDGADGDDTTGAARSATWTITVEVTNRKRDTEKIMADHENGIREDLERAGVTGVVTLRRRNATA